MSGLDVNEVRAGVSGAVLTAPLGSTAPDDTASPWGADWTDHGELTEDGPTVQNSMESKKFKGWRTLYGVRTVVTDRGMRITFTLIQKNGENLKLAFGGGTVTDLGAGDYLFEPPQGQEVDYRMFGVEVLDGDIIDRYLLERALVVDLGAIPFKRDEPVKFDLTVEVSAAPGADEIPWKLVSNDPAMAEGAVS